MGILGVGGSGTKLGWCSTLRDEPRYMNGQLLVVDGDRTGSLTRPV